MAAVDEALAHTGVTWEGPGDEPDIVLGHVAGDGNDCNRSTARYKPGGRPYPLLLAFPGRT